MTGAERIAAERRRQMQREGWTAEHDAKHSMGELATAAMCYAELVVDPEIREISGGGSFVAEWWPFEPENWKPSDDPIRNLEKAGALIAAEIDRLITARSVFALPGDR